MRKEVIGAATLYCGDALEILPTLSGDESVLSDPPYGIGYVKGSGGKGCHSSRKNGGEAKRNIDPVFGDNRPFDPTPWLEFPEVILWGANHFARRLPDDGRWLAWNKLGHMEPWDSFSDVEFAWCSSKGADRIFSHLWKGLCQKGAGVRRDHPTQKPVELMAWCLSFMSGQTIIDPYMGSGTTLVAALKLGRPCIGIEIDQSHFEVACRRVSDATADLFVPQPDLDAAYTHQPPLFTEVA